MHPSATHVLTATLVDDQALLSFRLGLADGITLFSRRESEQDFSPIAEDDPSPVVDSRPKLNPSQPETRCYRAILRYSSSENRQLSDEVWLTLP
jgi:hypothetical protein